MTPLRVLHVHVVGPFGGSSRSLFEMLSAMPEGSVAPHFLMQQGTAEPYFAKLGPVVTARALTRFDNTAVSHYRGARWLVLCYELLMLPITLLALLRARKQFGQIDVIHGNDIVAVVPTLLAGWLFKAPVVLHVRCVMRPDLKALRSRMLNHLITTYCKAVIAIDETVRASLPADMPVTVIHNTFIPQPADQFDPGLETKLAALDPSAFKVGFVGNLHATKGIVQLVEAIGLVRARGVNVQLVVAGGQSRSGGTLTSWLLKLLGLEVNSGEIAMERIKALNLESSVHFLGFTNTISRVFEAVDVLCFPIAFQAPGRPIMEAAHFGVPAIARLTNPKPDTLEDGVTGIAVGTIEPEELAGAIQRLAAAPELTKTMGKAAKALAEKNFSAAPNARRFLEVLTSVFKRQGQTTSA